MLVLPGNTTSGCTFTNESFFFMKQGAAVEKQIIMCSGYPQHRLVRVFAEFSRRSAQRCNYGIDLLDLSLWLSGHSVTNRGCSDVPFFFDVTCYSSTGGAKHIHGTAKTRLTEVE